MFKSIAGLFYIYIMKKEKLDAFTDAVIAIIITLMVLEIKLPKVTAQNLLSVLGHIGIYALSFVAIGITWLNYSTFFKYVEKLNARIIWLNLAFLFVLSLIPLATQSLGEDFDAPASHMFYGVILGVVSLMYTLLQYSANPFIAHLSKAEINRMNRKNWITILMYFASAPLSLISIYLSTAVFILLPATFFLPERKLLQKHNE